MAKRSNYAIIAGPSREEIFDALRLRHEQRKVEFTLEVPRNQELILKGHVNSIDFFDITGNHWFFTLYDPDNSLGYKYIKGYIDITLHSGWVGENSRS